MNLPAFTLQLGCIRITIHNRQSNFKAHHYDPNQHNRKYSGQLCNQQRIKKL